MVLAPAVGFGSACDPLGGRNISPATGWLREAWKQLKRVPAITLRRGWYTYLPGSVDRTRPGLYEWHIEGVGSYVGKYTRISRPEREYSRNLIKMLNGWPYRPKFPDKFRRIHCALRDGYDRGARITLTLLENVEPSDLSRREAELIAERGSLNVPPFGVVPSDLANSGPPIGLAGRRKLMTDQANDDVPKEQPEAPDRPRLTPQGHASGSATGEDSTDP